MSCVCGIINIYERCQKMQHVRAPVCVWHATIYATARYDTIRYDIPHDICRHLSRKICICFHQKLILNATCGTCINRLCIYPIRQTNVNNISNTLYSIDEAVSKQLKVNKTSRNHRKFHNEMYKIQQIEMEYENDL